MPVSVPSCVALRVRAAERTGTGARRRGVHREQLLPLGPARDAEAQYRADTPGVELVLLHVRLDRAGVLREESVLVAPRRHLYLLADAEHLAVVLGLAPVEFLPVRRAGLRIGRNHDAR
jgi:hypothetical protein